MKKIKTPKCPACGSAKVVVIVYGLPLPKAFEMEEKGLVKLGGCCIDDDSPRWHCNDCQHDWGKMKI